MNVYGRHKINQSSELSADIDYVHFIIENDQCYQTQLVAPGSAAYVTEGNIPSGLDIVTAKFDYSKRFNNFLLETGLKTAINQTNNIADCYYYYNNNRLPELRCGNHFFYNKNMCAAYASTDAVKGKWH